MQRGRVNEAHERLLRQEVYNHNRGNQTNQRECNRSAYFILLCLLMTVMLIVWISHDEFVFNAAKIMFSCCVDKSNHDMTVGIINDTASAAYSIMIRLLDDRPSPMSCNE